MFNHLRAFNIHKHTVVKAECGSSETSIYDQLHHFSYLKLDLTRRWAKMLADGPLTLTDSAAEAKPGGKLGSSEAR